MLGSVPQALGSEPIQSMRSFYNTQKETGKKFLSTFIKLLPLIVTFLGCFFSFYIYIINTTLFFFIKKNKTFKYFYFFLLKKWYSDRFINQIFTLFFLKISKSYMYNSLDRGLLELIGPFTISNIVSILKKKFFI